MPSSTHSRPRSAAGLLLVGLLGLSLPARAQAQASGPQAPAQAQAQAQVQVQVQVQDGEAQARARFAEGNVAYDVGDFGKALKAFTEAYRLKPLPGFLFNIAQCHRQLGQYSRAAFFYRRYMSLAPDAPSAPVVGELVQEMEARAKEQEARRLERERAERDRAVQQARAQAARAEAEAAARRRAEREAEQQALSARTAEAILQPAPQGMTQHGAVSTPWTRKWWVWAGAGAAAALVTTGVIMATQGPDARAPSLGTVGRPR
jgi:tetratricopeptide (TPR) repeat protein